MRTGCVGGSGALLGGGYRTEEREDRGSHRHLPPLLPPPPFPPFLEIQLPTPSCGLRLTHVLSFPLPRSLGHSREKLRYEMHPAWFDGSLGPPVRIRQMISLPKPQFPWGDEEETGFTWVIICLHGLSLASQNSHQVLLWLWKPLPVVPDSPHSPHPQKEHSAWDQAC